MTEQPHTTEPVPVQLTRIEGTINLIAYQMTEAKGDIADIKKEQASLAGRLTIVEQAQAAAAGAGASWRGWLPIILAAASVALAFLLALTGG